VAPSAIAFRSDHAVPEELTIPQIHELTKAFASAAERALRAGFEVVEIHGAHGYLLNEFLSPLANHRTDEYGGSFENRIRFFLEVTDAVRAVWPNHLPLFARISATDWKEGGWDIDQSVALARELAKHGVDLIDCSSGGVVPDAKILTGPGYQVPFAKRIRAEGGILSGAVGLITEAHQAEEIISGGDADIVLLARELLRDPYWPHHAARELGAKVVGPVQYHRAL
jgi:2,4-dienoyl-CoA reductase-like NADH-dependent reductase (Old Yellow Enzyme family)